MNEKQQNPKQLSNLNFDQCVCFCVLSRNVIVLFEWRRCLNGVILSTPLYTSWPTKMLMTVYLLVLFSFFSSSWKYCLFFCKIWNANTPVWLLVIDVCCNYCWKLHTERIFVIFCYFYFFCWRNEILAFST